MKRNKEINSNLADLRIPSMNLKTLGSKQISLDQLVDMQEFDRVSVTIQVMKTDEPQLVTTKSSRN